MHRIRFALLAASLAMPSLGGCAFVASPVNGVLYTNVQGPVTATTLAKSTRVGEACASTILGVVATGDASIDAAKRAGQITEVSSVDFRSHHILLLYGQFCTIVHGE